MTQPLTFFLVMAATDGLYAQAFLRELKAQGHRVVVLTAAEALDYDWPREHVDALYAVRDIFDPAEVRNTVSYLAWTESIDRLVGPGEYDIELAAALREHLRVGGMGETTARYFRDKLAMRECAESAGIPIPAYIGAINHEQIARFMDRVPGPWLIKPRMAASSKGIRVLNKPDDAWRVLGELGDKASNHLIERFTAGDVYHVDGVVSGREVLFQSVHRYGRPILDLHTNGGVYTTWRVQDGSDAHVRLGELNKQVVKTFGLAAGVFHIEYIHGRADDRFYFLEASARVGAGLIEEMVEAESGINLWQEWARLEVGQVVPPYAIARDRDVYAGVLATATAAEKPDTRRYEREGVRALPAKPHHMGLLVTGPDEAHVAATLRELAADAGRQTVQL